MRFPMTKSIIGSPSPMTSPERIGSFRLRTTGSASRPAFLLKQKQGLRHQHRQGACAATRCPGLTFRADPRERSVSGHSLHLRKDAPIRVEGCEHLKQELPILLRRQVSSEPPSWGLRERGRISPSPNSQAFLTRGSPSFALAEAMTASIPGSTVPASFRPGEADCKRACAPSGTRQCG